MPRQHAVIKSHFRKEIEEMILEGKSPRYISSWLKDRDENISHSSINRYRKTDFNIKEEAVKEYNNKQSKARKQKGIKKTVSEIEYCDDVIEIASKVGLSVNREEGTTALDIKKIGLQAVKVKHDITKDEPEPAPVNVNVYNNTKIERLRRIEENGSVLPITSAAKPDNRVKEDSKE